MSKKQWVVIALSLILTWIVDFYSKEWAKDLPGALSYLGGYLHFVLHHNRGAMLGLFSDLPPMLRVVTLSTFGAFIFCIYVIIQYLLPNNLMTLRCGLSILIGGILGNVTDRVLMGEVVDFVVIGTPQMSSPAFNLADLLQWVGYFMIAYSLIAHGDILFPKNDIRRKFWINHKFQMKYAFILMTVGLALSFIMLILSYSYLRITMIELVGHNSRIQDKFLIPFLYLFFFVTGIFCMILFVVGKNISHQIAGPLYAFQKYLGDIVHGVDRPFRLRAKDEFKELEQVANEIRDKLLHLHAQVALLEKLKSETATPVATELPPVDVSISANVDSKESAS